MKFEWTTEGFEAFRRGTFGNGGQNLYVSRRGVLQRIYQYDLNHNGYFDLVFANCQNHHESAPAYVYYRDGSMSKLPAQGAVSGAVADLNGSGYADLVICGRYDMAQPFASSDIYFGSEEPYSEKRHIRIPTPWAESVAAGRFNGGTRPALAFSLPFYGVVRIFYPSELGIEWGRYADLPLMTGQLTSGDLDGDGFDELIVRKNDSTETVVYWGGPDGISPGRRTAMPELPEADRIAARQEQSRQSQLERELKSSPLPRIIDLGTEKHLAVITGQRVIFYACDKKRQFREAFDLKVPNALAVAAGDLRNNGETDLFIASRFKPEGADTQQSYLYRGGPGGYRDENRQVIPTVQATDAVMADLDGNGHADLIIAQSHTEYLYTNHILLYRGSPDGIGDTPEMLEGEDVQRVFAVPRPDGSRAVLAVNHYSRSAVGFDKSYIYWGGPDGYSPDRMQEVPGWCAVDSICADLNDDGWAELVICNNSENSLHLDPGFHVHHFGPGGFEPEKSFQLPAELGWGAVCADFNRDGCLDIIAVANHWRDLKIFYGGPGGFRKSELIPLDNRGSARWILAVDLNKNGWLDLIVPLINADRTLILHGGPQGFSMERHSELAVFHGTCARAADLTGNGYPDLIVGTHIETPNNGELTPHNPHHSYIHIYWNGPGGLSENNKTILRADAAVAMAVADFNNDGWLDIFVSNYHNGKERDIHSILYWNRQGQFRELDRQLIFTHSASGCIAADFNEDGYIDLAVANHKVDGDHLGFSTVWWNGPDGFDRRRSTDLPTAGPHGMTAIEPGNQLDRGPEEYYISEPFQLPRHAVLEGIDWKGEIPPKTWVSAKIRTAATPEDLDSAEWQPPDKQKIKSGEWIQYRLALGAVNSLRTPRITGVTVTFAADAPLLPLRRAVRDTVKA